MTQAINHSIKILLISDVSTTFQFFKKLAGKKFLVDHSLTKENGLKDFSGTLYDYIFIDLIALKEFDGRKKTPRDFSKYLKKLWKAYNSAKIIVLASPTETRECVYAMKAGADNYLSYPLNEEEVTYIVSIEKEKDLKEQEISFLSDQLSLANDEEDKLTSKSPKMKAILGKVRAVAETKTTVLLIGETGTGKSVLAKYLHEKSNRSSNTFLNIHCGAIPETLVESELFGHEKGSFTGAIKRKLGKFEMAHDGTIFLDEIGTISHQTQIKLLQVLQERFFQRVGGEVDINVDVRVIAATNIGLKDLVSDGKFREDLFYRLNVFPIIIPPLRERLEDIPDLAASILEKLSRQYLKNIQGIDSDVLEMFKSYSWPGNVRELENVMERAYILETTNLLRLESFPKEMFETSDIEQIPIPVPSIEALSIQSDDNSTLSEARKNAVEIFERNYLKNLLEKNKGKISSSAQVAGITTRQLHKLLKKYDLRGQDYRTPQRGNTLISENIDTEL
ncbi:MAG: sigma-54-dependent Fis family transcriptional regulator [Bacteriovoracaceae bacterium]|nr:sigma-54-dependent Fis family transcriptional regulator [Bacteriovoracaceae bacterium]